MIVDNRELAKDRLLQFKSDDDFYNIKIIARKKDVAIEGVYDKVLKSNWERIISWFTIRTMEDYLRTIELIKSICLNKPYRVYLDTDVKSFNKTVVGLQNSLNEIYNIMLSDRDRLIHNHNKHYFKKFEDMMKSVTCKETARGDRSRQYILYDVDSEDDLLKDKLWALYGRCFKPDTIWYDTFSGYHILVPLKIYGDYMEKYHKSKNKEELDADVDIWYQIENHKDVSVKRNACMLLYADSDTFNKD